MEKIELKPCPFCGSDCAVYSEQFDSGYYIICSGDNCDATIGDWRVLNREKAIKAWNRRTK